MSPGISSNSTNTSCSSSSTDALPAVRWRVAGVPCELRCADVRALGHAAVVLRGSIDLEPAGAGPVASVCWHLTPPGADGEAHAAPEVEGPGWIVRRDGTDETWRRKDLDVALRVIEFGTVLAVVGESGRLVTLHGALLDRSGRGLLILGPCESGKSTLAAALWRDGWTLLGDDVSVAEGGARARPLQRRVSLRHGSRELLGEALWQRVMAAPSCSTTDEGYLFHPAELDDAPPPASTQLAGIVFLARRGVRIGPAEVSPITGAQALLAVAPYSNVIRREGLAAALRRLQSLVEAAAAFDLGRGPLPAMIEAIERHVLAGSMAGRTS